jgi:hypothetical protein
MPALHARLDSGAGYSAACEYSQHLDVLDVGHDEPERRVHCKPDVVPSLPVRTRTRTHTACAALRRMT